MCETFKFDSTSSSFLLNGNNFTQDEATRGENPEFDLTTSSFLENVNSLVLPEPEVELIEFNSTSSSFLLNVNTFCTNVKLKELFESSEVMAVKSVNHLTDVLWSKVKGNSEFEPNMVHKLGMEFGVNVVKLIWDSLHDHGTCAGAYIHGVKRKLELPCESSKKLKLDLSEKCELDLHLATENLAKVRISNGGQVRVISSMLENLELGQGSCGVPAISVATSRVAKPRNDPTPPLELG